MADIKKLPIFFSIIVALIASLSAVANGKEFTIMAYEVSIAIVVTYVLGLLICNAVLKIINEKQYTENIKLENQSIILDEDIDEQDKNI